MPSSASRSIMNVPFRLANHGPRRAVREASGRARAGRVEGPSLRRRLPRVDLQRHARRRRPAAARLHARVLREEQVAEKLMGGADIPVRQRQVGMPAPRVSQMRWLRYIHNSLGQKASGIFLRSTKGKVPFSSARKLGQSLFRGVSPQNDKLDFYSHLLGGWLQIPPPPTMLRQKCRFPIKKGNHHGREVENLLGDCPDAVCSLRYRSSGVLCRRRNIAAERRVCEHRRGSVQQDHQCSSVRNQRREASGDQGDFGRP